MKKISIGHILLASSLILVFPLVSVAHEAGDLILRVGAASVQPSDSSGKISTTATGTLAGTSVGTSDNTQLGLNLIYMISDNIGLEVLAASPFEHDLSVRGLAQYGFNITDLGSTDQLPPTFSALYYFGNSSSAFRPYVGGGFNYTTFFSTGLSDSAKSVLGASNLELEDSFGVSVRAGFDYELDDGWMLNASLWYIEIETDATFDSALGQVKSSVGINPWVYMISLGYKF